MLIVVLSLSIICLFQLYLCYKKNKYIGLFIPIILSTLIAIMASDFFIAFFILFISLMPIIIWLLIYSIGKRKTNKASYKIKFKYILITVLSIIIFTSIGVIYNKKVMSTWTPSKELVGTWTGKGKISSKFSKTELQVPIKIIINNDGTTYGTIGDAKLTNCHIYLNRNNFEKFINIKTDFIIRDGYIEGTIISKDKLNYRNTSIPFSIKNNNIKGSIFSLKTFEYPYPIFTGILLKHK